MIAGGRGAAAYQSSDVEISDTTQYFLKNHL